jgi:hypothetical protein
MMRSDRAARRAADFTGLALFFYKQWFAVNMGDDREAMGM